MSEKNRGSELILGLASVVALGVLASRLSESIVDTRPTSLSYADEGITDQDEYMERGILHARAVTACDSLTQEEEDGVIRQATGIPGKDAYTEYQLGAHQDPTVYSIGQLNAMNLDILVGCLRQRNEPGDREAAQRLDRIGFW